MLSTVSLSLVDLHISCSFSDSWEAAVLIPSQLTFPKWKCLLGFCWVLYGLMHESESVMVMTALWSERPGRLTEALVREGFVVKMRSKLLPCHVGNSWMWVRLYLKDTLTSFYCTDLSLGHGGTVPGSQSMSGQLKSPQSMKSLFFPLNCWSEASS